MKSLTTLVNSENSEVLYIISAIAVQLKTFFFFKVYNYIGTQTYI